MYDERLLYPSYEIINGEKIKVMSSTPYHCYIMQEIKIKLQDIFEIY